MSLKHIRPAAESMSLWLQDKCPDLYSEVLHKIEEMITSSFTSTSVEIPIKADRCEMDPHVYIEEFLEVLTSHLNGLGYETSMNDDRISISFKK